MTINSPKAQLTIRSTRIHTPEGWRDGTVVVYGGKIAGVVEPGLAPAAERHIDAGDKPVIPGLIDTHVHVRDPGFTQKDDWFSASQAAAAGGVTTIIDMPNVQPVPNNVEVYRSHTANAAGKSVVNVDPKKDTRILGGQYGVDLNPVDDSTWYAQNNPYGSPVLRFVRGDNPPETCMTEYYEPPKKADGTYVAFDTRGIGVGTDGIVHASFGSGKIGKFDRSKCKVLKGPTATGQHCPEGWTFIDVPGPKMGKSEANADWFYLNWVDTYDTLGLGANMPLTVGSNSDALIALMPGDKVVNFRVPYPIGSFYSRGMDGRIDNPNTGWKGKGIWASQGKFPVWHQEGGDEGRGPQLIKFQVRPDPLAH